MMEMRTEGKPSASGGVRCHGSGDQYIPARLMVREKHRKTAKKMLPLPTIHNLKYTHV
ncbi:hypothetical protein HanIR_Chr13g0667691 [Helianthus annuus]|nr:hypothetical protein HanIR_Chr13g0667691 [Helianthus annuus]